MEPQRFLYVSHIRTTPERLWEALVDPEFIRDYWFGRRHGFGPAGSAIESRSPEGELEWTGVVLRSEPPRLLEYSFEDQENPDEGPSLVTFEIEPLGEGTMLQGDGVQLTVTHRDFPPGSKVYPGICKGWPAILSGLKTLLETGDPMGLAWKGDGS